jgi:hypothetical protein
VEQTLLNILAATAASLSDEAVRPRECSNNNNSPVVVAALAIAPRRRNTMVVTLRVPTILSAGVY